MQSAALVEPGDIIILRHPHFNRHTLAIVHKKSPKFVWVSYFYSQNDDWSKMVTRRSSSHILRVLPTKAWTLKELKEVAANIAAAQQQRDHEMVLADIKYLDTIAGML